MQTLLTRTCQVRRRAAASFPPSLAPRVTIFPANLPTLMVRFRAGFGLGLPPFLRAMDANASFPGSRSPPVAQSPRAPPKRFLEWWPRFSVLRLPFLPPIEPKCFAISSPGPQCSRPSLFLLRLCGPFVRFLLPVFSFVAGPCKRCGQADQGWRRRRVLFHDLDERFPSFRDVCY